MAHLHHFQHLQARGDDIQTVVSIVYVTASATFDGPIAGYTTIAPGEDNSSTTVSPTEESTSAATTNTVVGTPLRHTTVTAGTTITVHKTASTSSLTTSRVNPIRSQKPGTETASTTATSSSVLEYSSSTYDYSTSSVSDSSTSSLAAISTTLLSSTISSTSAVSSTSSSKAASSSTVDTVSAASSVTTTKDDSSSGMSSGAKAGIAIGVLCVVGLICALAFIFFRRKRTNEDHEQIEDEKTKRGPSSRHSIASSFRQSYIKAPRLSLGPLNHLFAGAAEKPAPRTNSNDLTNPFGDHAEAIVDEKNHPMLPQAGPLAAAAVPKPLSIKSDRTGNGQTSSTGSPMRAQATPSSNVHRVQLDFLPSMDDELELRSGQLVRMLHEYDDGWALCIRLDRSQQGVVPRTCISKLPLKPRPAGPGPQGHPGHRNTPGGSMSSTASFGSDDSTPRPLSPGGRTRAQTGPLGNGPYGTETRQRANSTAASSISPLNPTLPTNGGGLPLRKPVPGQAM